MFDLDPAHVTIYTDTLALTEDGQPAQLAPKCVLIPNWRLAVVTTGSAALQEAWTRYLAGFAAQALTITIDDVDEAAPTDLPMVLAAVPPSDAELTSTVYHFGVGRDGAFRGYKYLSEHGFESEPLPYGFAIKPSSFFFDGSLRLPERPPETPQEIVDLAETVRAATAARVQATTADEDPWRWTIGGELECVSCLADDAVRVTVHRFDDYDEMADAVDRLNFDRVVAGVAAGVPLLSTMARLSSMPVLRSAPN
jgi:hypothetical protein